MLRLYEYNGYYNICCGIPAASTKNIFQLLNKYWVNPFLFPVLLDMYTPRYVKVIVYLIETKEKPSILLCL